MITLTDSQCQRLQELADRYGVTASVLLKAQLEEWLFAQNEAFDAATDEVLAKNSDLDQCLAD